MTHFDLFLGFPPRVAVCLIAAAVIASTALLLIAKFNAQDRKNGQNARRASSRFTDRCQVVRVPRLPNQSDQRHE